MKYQIDIFAKDINNGLDQIYNSNKMKERHTMAQLFVQRGSSPKNQRLNIKPKKINYLELSNRLKTLKNYDTWRKTKGRRIRLQGIENIETEPIISIIKNCGNKNDKNLVFQQFMAKYDQKGHEAGDKNTSQLIKKLINSNKNSKNPINFIPLSYFNYKIRNFQKSIFQQKIKVRNSSNSKTLRKIKSQPKPQLTQHFSIAQVPRQLQNLKQQIKNIQFKNLYGSPKINDKLSSLQNINMKSNLFQSEQMDDLFLHSKLFKKSKIQQKRHKSFQIKSFKKEIGNIIHNAQELIQQNEQKIDNLQNANHIRKNSLSLDKERHTVKHKYWPSYQKYTVSKEDSQRMDNIQKIFSDFNEYSHDYALSQQLSDLIVLIKKDFDNQEKNILNQAISLEKNSVSFRFNQKIRFQKYNYKRNIQNFIKSKKQYRLDRQRQPVRANGIKRMKRQTIEKTIKFVPDEDQQLK